jgi:ferredoxin--NADP+ reductase/benzoate/toluate 1,2-dioxygenase reductase subunit
MDYTALKIREHVPVGRDAFLIRMERPDWSWQAGQLISLCGENPLDQRDYTIASGEQDETLDVLYRLIPHGIVTPHLRKLQAGDRIPVQGPYGRFVLRDPERPLLFCATGTGIAPCRAYLRSHPPLSLTLLHGVRFPEDLYFQQEFASIDYHPYCSRAFLNGTTNRLTEALPDITLSPRTQVYLCGANEMIYEAEEILLGRGVAKTDIFHEPYYYRAYDE